MAAFPVVGPHADIEAELMLAGGKPLMWMPVAPDDAVFDDPYLQREHEGRKRLDKAVEDGKLISIDVEHALPDNPENIKVTRHYAQPENEEKLERVVAFNKQAFSFNDVSDVHLDQDIGHYLGYRRRDILFFSHVVSSDFVPASIASALVKLNAPFQQARREQLLLDSGCNLEI